MPSNNITFEISDKIQRADRDFSLFDGCKKILVALSGGADSCCLLLSLWENREKYGFSLCALHVNHGIRGKEADRDEDFARNLCQKYGIEFFCEKADVPLLSRQSGLSEELCARNVRYGLFEKYCREHSFDAVAVAHNAGDNAETVLFNLARGTALKGLCGIPPKRALTQTSFIIRPLIYVSRTEIEECLKEKGQDFVTDSTNLSDDYTRNFLRHEVIPALRKINPSFENSVLRSAGILRQDEDYLEKTARSYHTKDLRILSGLDRCILTRVIRNLYCEVSDEMPLFSHIDALVDKIYYFKYKPSLRCSLSFPDGKKAYIENGILSFREDTRKKEIPLSFNISLCEGINIIDGTDFLVYLSYKDSTQLPQFITHNNEIIYKKYTTDYLYSDKIFSGLCAKSRSCGDKILHNGINKSLKRLMCQMKTPSLDRFSLPVITQGEEILLVPTVAKCSLYTQSTGKHVVCVALYRR